MATPKYNPAFLDSAERARRFAGRQHDLAEILRVVHENAFRAHNQHLLVLGPRGMGKTTLLLRAADVVRETPEFAEAWFPIVAPEELYQAGSLGELWLEMVLQLAHATGDDRHLRAHAALKPERDDGRLAASALAHLLDFADRQSCRLLLVMENLHMLFDEQLDEKDAWAFREVLLHERRIMVLASAIARFDGIRQPDAAMYELFQIHPLAPLDRQGCMALWQAATKAEVPEPRMRAMEILTGGNPRLLTILADFACQRSLAELTRDLTELIDEHTDYLKMTTEALPSLERKVFVGLAQIWEEAPASRVAEETRLALNVTSAQLARLESRGIVLSRRQGRGKVYRLAERLYNLYHLVRRRGGAATRARAAVAFMSFYYSPDSLAHHAQDLCGDLPTLPAERQADGFHILAELLACEALKPWRARLAERIPEPLLAHPEAPEALRQAVRKARKGAGRKDAAAREALVEQARRAGAAPEPEVRQAFRNELEAWGAKGSKAWRVFGESLTDAGWHAEALEALERAVRFAEARIEQGDSDACLEGWMAMMDLGRLQGAGGNLEAAMGLFQRAAASVSLGHEVDLHPLLKALSHGDLADVLWQAGQKDEALAQGREALAQCRLAAEIPSPGYQPRYLPRCLSRLGTCLAEVGSAEEALPLLEEAVDHWQRLAPDPAGLDVEERMGAAFRLTHGLVRQHRTAEAARRVQEAEAWIRGLDAGLADLQAHWLAVILFQKSGIQLAVGHADEALATAEGFMALARRHLAEDPGCNPIFHQMACAQARLLRTSGRLDEAIALYRELLDRQDPDPGIHSDLCHLLLKTGRLQEAETHFRIWVQHADPADGTPEAVIQPALGLAAADRGAAVLEALAASPLAPRLEPLLVALRRHLDPHAPRAPELIEAIADDLLQDIRGLAPQS